MEKVEYGLLNPATGEVKATRHCWTPDELADWLPQFATYEIVMRHEGSAEWTPVEGAS